MTLCRRLWAEGDSAGVLKTLEDYRSPDAAFDQEQLLLRYLALTDLADRAIREDRLPYAQTLLGQAAGLRGIYLGPALSDHLRMLLARAGEPVPPDVDEGLLLLARQALKKGDAARALELLPAAANRTAPLWHLLMGKAHYALGNYAAALPHLTKAESSFPAETVPALELCYKELGDFQKAYEYACKGRK
jgi:tetratricopeptide (TPR) repeat protein